MLTSENKDMEIEGRKITQYPEMMEKEMVTQSSIPAWEIPWQRSLEGTVHGLQQLDTT